MGRAGVALRKESVDRNKAIILAARLQGVALRKESVDRNFSAGTKVPLSKPSLSARRAWIEICCGAAVIAFLSGSLSARRAWIEIVRGAIAAYPVCRSPQGERG